MKSIVLAALGFAVLASSSALASEWKHSELVSAEGVAVEVDYTVKSDVFTGCYKCTLYTRSDALWINVSAPNLSEGDKVRAVLVNKGKFATTPDVLHFESKEIDLTYAGNGRFTADAGSLRIWGAGYAGTETFTLELALVVNGTWLKDPVSKTNNFVVPLQR